MRIEPNLSTKPRDTPASFRDNTGTGKTAPPDQCAMYGLSAPPFDPEPKQGRFLALPSHQPVLQSLIVGLRRDGGHMILIGQPDSGRTWLATAALDQALARRDDVTVIRGADRLPFPPSEIETQTRRIIIIDDADRLPQAMLVRIVNFVTTPPNEDRRLLLIGTPALMEILQEPPFRPFASHITMKLQVPPCTPAEIEKVLQHGLWQVGGSLQKILTRRALRDIVRRAEGRPGRATDLLLRVIASGFLQEDALISHKTVIAALGRQVRPTSRRPELADAHNVMNVLAALMLAIGIALFWWTGFHPDDGPKPPQRPTQSQARQG